MPVHPAEACYAHVIAAGHANIARHLERGGLREAGHELVHVREVNAILTDFLLYAPNDPRWSHSSHDRYWDALRPAYVAKADPVSVLEFTTAWEFLAHATRPLLREEISKEAHSLRERLKQQNRR